MEWTTTIVYIIGALVTHYIIYRNSDDNIEHASANIACILWPVAVLICLILEMENICDKCIEWYRNR